MLVLLFTLLAHAAPLQFAFVGQPDCVRLAYAEGRTTLENGCDQPVLVDQSVVRPTGRHATGIVPAGVTTSLKDLSWFTLGYEGQIYKVVAVVAEPDHPEVSETGTLQAEQPVAETPAPVDTALP